MAICACDFAAGCRLVRATMEPKRRRSREARKAQDAQRSREWRMVVIDQGPLRQNAASECQREMKRLETI
jgi:hypothetical protein